MESAHQTTPLSFAALLKRFRRAAGLSQEGLAERAGYSVGHISKLEGSTRLPSPATAELLADALELSEMERSMFLRAARQRGPSFQAPDPTASQAQPLVNRELELSLVDSTLWELEAPALLLFAGLPGIGKSALLTQAAARAHGNGWTVLQGASHRYGVDVPYSPVLGAIASCLSRMSGEQAREALHGCSWLSLLLPELVESGLLSAPPANIPPDQTRRLAFVAVRRFLSNIAGVAGTVLVLDNLESSSADAVALIGSLLHNGDGMPLRVIGATQMVALQAGTALTGLIADLTRGGGPVCVHTVEALTSHASRQLMNVRLAELVPPESVRAEVKDELLRRSSGNPLAIVSYTQAVGASADHELPASIPSAVIQTIHASLDEASPAERQVAQVVAVAGGPIPCAAVVMVAGALGASEQAVVQALDRGCRVKVLLEHPEGVYEFVSDTVAQAIEQELGNAQRTYLHREIANALAHLSPAGQDASLAAHYSRAGNSVLAASYLAAAGHKARARTAYAESARYFAASAQQYDAHGQVYEAARTREHLGIALGLLGLHDDALTVLDCARQGFRSLSDPEGQGRVAALVATIHAERRPSHEALTHIESEAVGAIAERLPLREQASISLALARAYRRLGRYAEALRAVEHTAALAREAHDQTLVMVGELERGTTLDEQRTGDAGLRVLESVVLPFTSKYDTPWLEYQALSQDMRDHIFHGDFDQAQRAITRVGKLANRLGDPHMHARAELAAGVVHFYRGSWTAAQRELLRAQSTLHREGRLRPACAADSWLTRLFVARDYPNEAGWCFERIRSIAEAEGDQGLTWRATAAFAERALIEEQVDNAFAMLEASLEALDKREIDRCEALSLLAWAHLQRGDAASAASLSTQSIQRLKAAGATSSFVDAQCVLARVQMHQGDLPLALATLREALGLARLLPYPYIEAKALYLSGQAHALGNDHQLAQDALEKALGLCVQLGERLYVKHIERALDHARPDTKPEPGLVRS